MKLLTLLLPLLTAVVLVPTAVSRPLIRDPTTGPALVGKPRSIGQASHYSPKPVQLDTNAKRFARGLPPLAPSKSRRYKASPVRRTGASPLPPITYSGVIKVSRRDNGADLGYISSIGYGNQFYRPQNNRNGDTLRVHLTVPREATGTVSGLNIEAENSKLFNWIVAGYVGLAVSPYADGTAGSESRTVYLAATEQTSVDSKPTVGANSWTPGAKIESAVWTVDVSTWSLTLKWTNPDGNPGVGTPFLWDQMIGFGDKEWWTTTGKTYGVEVVGLSFTFVRDLVPE